MAIQVSIEEQWVRQRTEQGGRQDIITGTGGEGHESGINPNHDINLAMAFKLSREEQKTRQRAEQGGEQDGVSGQDKDGRGAEKKNIAVQVNLRCLQDQLQKDSRPSKGGTRTSPENKSLD